MKYPRYQAYKPSGIPWLSEIPAHWTEKRFRFVAELNPVKSGVNYLPEDTLVSFVPMEAVGEYGGLSLESEKQIAEVKAGYTYFADGDVVLAKITPCFENGKGALAEGLLNGIAFGTTELHVVRAGKQLDRRFLFYLTMSHPFRKIGEAMMYGAGGQKRVPEDFIKDFSPGLPPLDEQAAIAAFLDRETARIDTLIEKKRRFIELLQEKRSALISHAVTRGLNPDAPLKDSGIEWLGRIPAHWEVKRLKFLVDNSGHGIQMGPFGTMLKDLEVADTGFKVYGQENTINDDFEAGNRWLSPQHFAELQKYELISGDIVLTRKGSIGQCRLVPSNIVRGIADSDTIRVRLDESQMLSQFLVLIMHEAAYIQGQIFAVRRGAILGGLNTATIANLLIAIPLVHEQIKIKAAIGRKTTRLDNLRTKVESAIDKLKEYRAALISAAVTGKIDVREAA